MRSVQLGFTEPYLFDRPLQAGFTVYLLRASITTRRGGVDPAGTNLIPLYNQLGTQNLLNYISERLRRHGVRQLSAAAKFCARSASPTATTFQHQDADHAATTYFDYIDFQRINGRTH